MKNWGNICATILSISLICPVQCDQDYNFLTFENFVINEKLFKLEIQTIEHIRRYREYLEDMRSAISGYVSKPRAEIPGHTFNNSLQKISVRRDSQLFNLKSHGLSLPDFKKISASISEIMDIIGDPHTNMIGAGKALVMLQDTYDLDVLEMAQGRVKYKNKVFQGAEKLDIIDLFDLASISYHQNWLDSSIKFLRGAKALFKAKNDAKSIPPNLSKEMEDLSKLVVKIHNNLIMKRKRRVGEDYKVFPYLLDENMKKKKAQPKSFKKIDFWARNMTDHEEYRSGIRKEDGFRRTCRGSLVGTFDDKYTQPYQPKCRWLHQNDPYLVLGPFKLEEFLIRPYRVVFHDFLTEKEIEWMIEYSRPRMSRNRGITMSNFEGSKNDYRSGKRTKTIHKTVQVWFNDIQFNEEPEMDLDINYTKPMKDPYGFKITNPLIYKLSRKIEMATKTNVTSRWGASLYQTTNYGLGGLCETHLDPHGYLDNVIVPKERAQLYMTGDMVATFMAWLADVPAGGGTGYDFPTKEMLVEPRRGSAAFWMNLKANGARESASTHGGCPVLIGSKWILNKWIYIFDQWKEFPCQLDKNDFIPPFTRFFKSIEMKQS